MKTIFRLGLLITILLVLLIPGPAQARGLTEDKVIFGGTYSLSSGETLDGSLILLGGSAALESDSSVNGDVVIMGGSLKADGQVSGSIVGIGGLVSLGDNAEVTGDVMVFGAHLDRSEGAQVIGEVSTDFTGPLAFTIPGGVEAPRIDIGFNPIVDFTWFMFRTFVWAALAVLIVLFLPRQVTTTAQAAFGQPVVAGGLGLLTLVIAVPVIVILTITIILIPVSILAVAAVIAAWVMGVIALGLEVGKRLQDLFKQTWAPAVTAGLGTFILVLIVNGARAVVPCVGWVFPAVTGMLGIGAVLLTRFGTQPYPQGIVSPPTSPVPPAPVQPPGAIDQGESNSPEFPPGENKPDADSATKIDQG